MAFLKEARFMAPDKRSVAREIIYGTAYRTNVWAGFAGRD